MKQAKKQTSDQTIKQKLGLIENTTKKKKTSIYIALNRA